MVTTKNACRRSNTVFPIISREDSLKIRVEHYFMCNYKPIDDQANQVLPLSITRVQNSVCKNN